MPTAKSASASATLVIASPSHFPQCSAPVVSIIAFYISLFATEELKLLKGGELVIDADKIDLDKGKSSHEKVHISVKILYGAQ